MIPHAGAILAIRGPSPANNAEAPSVRTICRSKGSALVRSPGVDMTRDCLRVFKTSNGDVKSAAAVPLVAPHMNARDGPDLPLFSRCRFMPSYEARQRCPTPCARTSPSREPRTDLRVCGVLGRLGVDWRLVRMSSKGETMELTMLRANTPAAKGTTDGKGMTTGMTWRRR